MPGGAASKRKGTRGELKTRRRLEASGYVCIKSGGSLGAFDVIGIGAEDIVLVQSKVNGYASRAERAAMLALTLPTNARREIWRWLDRVREPLIERLSG